MQSTTVGVRRGRRAPTVIPWTTRARRGESGAVTAETAAVLPVLVALTLGLVWLVALAATQVRVVDAARETARAAARGESDTDALAAGAAVAPGRADVRVSRDGERVVAVVSAVVRGPGGLFAFVGGVRVHARAVAAEEPR